MSACYLRDFPGRCWPRIDRAHLIPKRIIKQQYPYGAIENDAGTIMPKARIEDYCHGGIAWHDVPLDVVLWDPRVYVPICRFHHAQLDGGQIHLPRQLVPVSTIDFADEHGLMWLVDRLYPVESEIAA